MRAWIFQDLKRKAIEGDKCPWSVGWYDASGKRKGKKIGAKSMAEKFRKKIEAQLALGLCTGRERTKWADFRKQFFATALTGKASGTHEQYGIVFDNFERVAAPVYLESITTAVIDSFKAKRAAENCRPRFPKAQAAGRLPKQKRRKPLQEGKRTSPATVNKELRHIRAALVKAKKWKMLTELPEFEMLPVSQRDPYYIDDATFKALYDACDKMSRPEGRHYTATDWWRALLCFAYMTGWRIGEILDLRRADVDLDEGVARVAAESTKGRREARIELNSIIIAHIRAIVDFQPFVFDWPHHERTLWDDFAALKVAAGVDFPGAFHRFRFGFANANVDTLDADLLQRLMRHQSASTTKIYINAADRMKRAGTAEKLHVPAFLKVATG